MLGSELKSRPNLTNDCPLSRVIVPACVGLGFTAVRALPLQQVHSPGGRLHRLQPLGYLRGEVAAELWRRVLDPWRCFHRGARSSWCLLCSPLRCAASGVTTHLLIHVNTLVLPRSTRYRKECQPASVNMIDRSIDRSRRTGRELCLEHNEEIFRPEANESIRASPLSPDVVQAYYTLFDVENLRVGFACDGNGCSGGTWHGQGGFMEIEENTSWRRLVWCNTIPLMLCAKGCCLLLICSDRSSMGRVVKRSVALCCHLRRSQPRCPLTGIHWLTSILTVDKYLDNRSKL